MADMSLDVIKSVVGVDHPSGGLENELVDVEKIIFSSRRQEAVSMNRLQRVYRWARWCVGLPRYIEYGRVVRAVTNDQVAINKIGGMYLKEILTGTSHCLTVDPQYIV